MSTSFEANGIITLITDFGLGDPFVGVMKGVILGRHPAARIVDLTHGAQSYSTREAGFWLSKSYGYFPAGTVHVAVVDPGVGTVRKILITELEGHVFLAPDNGLLTALLSACPDAHIYAFEPARVERLKLPAPSATFHGRDIFAPLAAELSRRQCQPAELGAKVSNPVLDPEADPKISLDGAKVEGLIVTVDRFGNLISNVDAQHLRAFKQPVVRAGGRPFPLRRTYGDGAPGDYLALVNAFGVIEIAQVQGNANLGLQLERGGEISITEKT